MAADKKPFEVVGYLHHVDEDGDGHDMPMYRHNGTGKFHHEGVQGDGPSEHGHDSPQAATAAFKEHAIPFLQRESDMSPEAAKEEAEGWAFHANPFPPSKLQKNMSYNDLKKAGAKSDWHSHKMERNLKYIFDTETNGKKYRTHVFHQDDESHVHTTGEHNTASQAKTAALDHLKGTQK
jgi:hypothetical protein